MLKSKNIEKNNSTKIIDNKETTQNSIVVSSKNEIDKKDTITTSLFYFETINSFKNSFN